MARKIDSSDIATSESLKPGAVYFTAGVDDMGKVFIQEWRIRSIRRPYGYLNLWVSQVTWGKLSNKHGDYGWLDPIDPLFRVRFRLKDGVPSGYARSKTAAVRKAIAEARESMRLWKDDAEIVAECAAEVAILSARLNRMK